METVGKLAPLGFGFMRLPLKDADDPTSIDIDKVCELVDIFMDAGFTYFDSARGYHGCKSEWALRKALVERYPRDSFTIATKLPAWLAKDADEARAMFDTSLEECGIDYFDYYLLHNLGETLTPPFDEYGLWEFCAEKKAEGKIKKFGFSIHDNAEELERVLDAHPEVDFVQLQINYVDWESDIIQSRKCYEVCQERGLPVVIMEPVKGGALANLPGAAGRILEQLHGGSQASYALRFAASFEGVAMVLSGMSSMEQMRENLDTMSSPQPLTAQEQEALRRACTVFKSQESIACTGCRYCEAGCPMHIQIPDLFAAFNAKKQGAENLTQNYQAITAGDHGKASSCIGCLQCESVCPQQLPVSSLLAQVADTLESCTPEACV